MPNYIQSLKEKNGYQYFVFNFVAVIILFFIGDVVAGKIFSVLYQKQRTGWEYRTKYSIEDTKADMLIFGSSRAQQQYNPLHFQERLKLSCYNVGRDGQVILYQYPVLKAILKRHTPKLIMLECDNRMFISNGAAYERLSCLYPFYKTHPEIRSILDTRSANEKVKMLSQMYPYNSTVFKIAQGIAKKEDEDINGYLPLNGALQEPIRKVDLTVAYTIDTNSVACFRNFVTLCKSSGVQLIATASPYFSDETGTDASLIIAKQIAVENNIPFYDLSKGIAPLNKSTFFDDTAHVNQTGSVILSNTIIDSIVANKVLYLH